MKTFNTPPSRRGIGNIIIAQKGYSKIISTKYLKLTAVYAYLYNRHNGESR